VRRLVVTLHLPGETTANHRIDWPDAALDWSSGDPVVHLILPPSNEETDQQFRCRRFCDLSQIKCERISPDATFHKSD
jgi:hypothetical protein